MDEGKILDLCIHAARQSDCEKFWFGAVLVEYSTELRHVTGHNRRLSPLKGVCEGTCARLAIPSRTHSMLGSCAHAEEWALAAARERKFEFPYCTMFIVGVDPKLDSVLLSGQHYTCIRCAVQMYMHGIARVKWWTDEGWKFVHPRLAVRQAYEFASQGVQL